MKPYFITYLDTETGELKHSTINSENIDGALSKFKECHAHIDYQILAVELSKNYFVY